ncbi:MAG: CPBP family intramembrane metalloprotease [Gemmatimonadetes bacterium]|uniref:CPBP family intramembrane metalloprotease n=1 Tax=Candidatus Kutchimonas denitrificans TaxID=3056748 RepID=A0AAE4Z6M6_9BACT|nr:CPBP family intramembrane metalloprotease [Gemmatimonadota bacterium]NIR73978.1 CPBP family intramembrane metalloprotease [Candidatus Kutchimonas denitrificans]NIS02967.1 CPBP family intramembrane metalloprotease [Gemmatimonadota bacterium]NIT68684.1 CPBP family intramembrane metalloprotease [Gemmatimonadota bacterium]NIU53265.1 CPBP family intramembrane metalloprotease [Gemmatimonadota bacterium]
MADPQDRAPEREAADRASGPEPGLGQVVLSLLVGLTLAVFLGGGALFVTGSLAVAALMLELGLLAGVILTLLARRQRPWGALRLRPVPRSIYVLAAVLGLVLLLVNIGASLLLGPPTRDIEFVISAEGTAERILLAVSIGLLAPLIEEMLFRGLLQGTLERRVRPWTAIGFTAVAFGALHGPQGAVLFFVWSLPVGWVTWRLDSIRPAVVIHAINNGIGLLGLLVTGAAEPPEPEGGAGSLALGVLLLAGAGLWIVTLCRRVDEVAARAEPWRVPGALSKPETDASRNDG